MTFNEFKLHHYQEIVGGLIVEYFRFYIFYLKFYNFKMLILTWFPFYVVANKARSELMKTENFISHTFCILVGIIFNQKPDFVSHNIMNYVLVCRNSSETSCFNRNTC